MSIARECSMCKTGLRLLKVLLLSLSLTQPATVFSAEERALPETVSRVDLDRYAGTWYEIARLPNRFQDHCAGNVTAEYRRLDDGNIEVVNRCVDKKGALDEAHGVARVVDTASNAKLEVSFVSLFGWQLFWGDYWILDLDDDYSHVVVGTPSRKYAWILARTTSLPAEQWERSRRVLLRAGYDPEKLVKSRQTDQSRR